MTKLILKAEKREDLGGIKPKQILSNDYLPVVVYGNKKDNLNLKVQYQEFERIFRQAGESQVLGLDVNGSEIPVLIHDVQHDALTGKIIHADLYQFDAKHKFIVEVPLHFIGESKVVKEMGATLVRVMDHVEIECLASALISGIDVDISKLENFNDSIHISDLIVPEGVEIMTEKDQVIAIAKQTRAEEEPKSEEVKPEETETPKEEFSEETKEE